MIPDVNVLVAAFRPDHEHHVVAATWLNDARNACATGNGTLVLPPKVVAGFLRVVTNHRVFIDPDPVQDAVAFVDALLETPSAELCPSGHEWPVLRDTDRGEPAGEPRYRRVDSGSSPAPIAIPGHVRQGLPTALARPRAHLSRQIGTTAIAPASRLRPAMRPATQPRAPSLVLTGRTALRSGGRCDSLGRRSRTQDQGAGIITCDTAVRDRRSAGA